LLDVTPVHVTKFKQSVIKNKYPREIHPARIDEDKNFDWMRCRAFFEDRANLKANLRTPTRAALPQTLSYAETKIHERELEKEAELRRYSDRNKKGRTSSNTHPVYKSEESDQDEDDNDVDKILSMVTTAKKAPRQHVAHPWKTSWRWRLRKKVARQIRNQWRKKMSMMKTSVLTCSESWTS
jgi:hypothetical protein